MKPLLAIQLIVALVGFLPCGAEAAEFDFYGRGAQERAQEGGPGGMNVSTEKRFSGVEGRGVTGLARSDFAAPPAFPSRRRSGSGAWPFRRRRGAKFLSR